MSNSALVSYTQLSPNCNAPRNQKISKITIHHMAGSLTLPQFGALVARPSRQMSANYAIDKNGNIVGEPIVGAITEKNQAKTLEKLIDQALQVK